MNERFETLLTLFSATINMKIFHFRKNEVQSDINFDWKKNRFLLINKIAA